LVKGILRDDLKGDFLISKIPADKEITLTFTRVGYEEFCEEIEIADGTSDFSVCGDDFEPTVMTRPRSEMTS